MRDTPTAAGAPLTPAERTTLLMIADGHGTTDVAHHLGVTDATVKSTLRRLQDKIGARGRPAMVDAAYRTGQLTPPAHADPPAGPSLNEEQHTILRLLARGATATQIGAQIYRSPVMVKTRLKVLYTVLGANTAAHAVSLGWGLGYLGTDHRPG